MLEGFQVGSSPIYVSHLQFAGDTLFMCGNSQRQIRYLRCILRSFESATGLHVNFGKSALFAVGEVPNIDMLATDLGYRVGVLPSFISWSSLGASIKRKRSGTLWWIGFKKDSRVGKLNISLKKVK